MKEARCAAPKFESRGSQKRWSGQACRSVHCPLCSAPQAESLNCSSLLLAPTRGWGADEEMALTEEVETLVGLPSSRHPATASPKPRWLPGASPHLQASMKPIQYE